MGGRVSVGAEGGDEANGGESPHGDGHAAVGRGVAPVVVALIAVARRLLADRLLAAGGGVPRGVLPGHLGGLPGWRGRRGLAGCGGGSQRSGQQGGGHKGGSEVAGDSVVGFDVLHRGSPVCRRFRLAVAEVAGRRRKVTGEEKAVGPRKFPWKRFA